MTTKRASNIKLLLAAIISHIFWGFSFLGTKSALGVVNNDLYLLLSHRFLIAFLIMNLLLLFRVKLKKNTQVQSLYGSSWWLSGKESAYQCQRCGFNP